MCHTSQCPETRHRPHLEASNVLNPRTILHIPSMQQPGLCTVLVPAAERGVDMGTHQNRRLPCSQSWLVRTNPRAFFCENIVSTSHPRQNPCRTGLPSRWLDSACMHNHKLIWTAGAEAPCTNRSPSTHLNQREFLANA